MSSALRVLGLWLLAMAAGAAVVWNSHFSADMSFFLPSKPSAEQKVLVGQLKDGTVSRLLMVAIEGGDAAARAKVSRALRSQLASQPGFVSVQNGEAEGLGAERDFLVRYRYQLSPAVTPERFTVEGLRAAVGDAIDTLASPVGMLFKPYLTRDPTGELLAVLDQLNPGDQPETRAGVWASRDGERAMLLLQTRALGSDTDGQEAAIAQVKDTFVRVAGEAGVSGLTLSLSGPGQFAVKSRATIKAEVSRLFLLSSLGIVVVLLAVYRSGRLLALSLLPVASGALAGVVVVSLVHGTVFGITVGFGSALIGEAVDYAIYFFVQSGRQGLKSWREVFWPTIRLGVLTSALGFGALLFSGFPGLAQLGLYALSGVVTAALVTRFVLPTLAGGHARVPVPGRFVNGLFTVLGQAHRLRLPVALLALAACVFLFVERDGLWDSNLSALSTVNEVDAANDGRLRSDLGAPDARYMVTVTAPDQESALQAAERAGERLDRLVADGRIGGYDSPARFLPSVQRQTARLASLPSASELQTRVSQALSDSPLSAGKLGGFIEDVEAARRGGVLQRKNLDGTDLALAVDSLLSQGPDGWNAMLPLRPSSEARDGELPVEQVRAALAGSGAVFVDMKSEFDTLYQGYLSEAVSLSLAGLVAIVGLLAFSLRSARRLARVLLTLVLTVAIVIAGLHLIGERLHLLHLVGMLLIVAVGSNYALFFDRAAGGEPLDAEILLSMAVAALTTTIGFGALALSSVPVLNAVGVTVGPGALLAILLSAVLVYPARAR